MSKILTWQESIIRREDREKRQNHKSAAIWFTGLSGAGKSTIAYAVESAIFNAGGNSYVLDGDNVRHGLCSDLSFSLEDRAENLRRIGETAKLFVDAGIIVLAAFISPLQRERERTRAIFNGNDFIEVYCNASIEVCESRDTKGLYKMARKGQIRDFTGISSPYEIPEAPDLSINTGEENIEDCVEKIVEALKERRIIK